MAANKLQVKPNFKSTHRYRLYQRRRNMYVLFSL